jgi:hypothetical protein
MNTVKQFRMWVRTGPNVGTLKFVLQGERNGANRPTAVALLEAALRKAQGH